jgi:hypothetical protein
MMGGYYDRLQAQLVKATERGAVRRRVGLRLGTPRLRIDFVAVAGGIAAVGVLVAVFIGTGGRHSQIHPAQVAPLGPAEIRNYAPGNAPPMGGETVRSTPLTAPSSVGSASGRVTFNLQDPSRYLFTITASGLVANTAHDVYTVWFLPAGATITGGDRLSGPIAEHAQLVGHITPGVDDSRTLAAEGELPAPLPTAGTNLILITLDTPPWATRPGRIVLEGQIQF